MSRNDSNIFAIVYALDPKTGKKREVHKGTWEDCKKWSDKHVKDYPGEMLQIEAEDL